MEREGEIRLSELKPGDILRPADNSGQFVFIGTLPHPLVVDCLMVIWWSWGRGYLLEETNSSEDVLPYTKLFRYDKASDSNAVLKLSINTWQMSGRHVR
jgi:hypothetical protein